MGAPVICRVLVHSGRCMWVFSCVVVMMGVEKWYVICCVVRFWLVVCGWSAVVVAPSSSMVMMPNVIMSMCFI